MTPPTRSPADLMGWVIAAEIEGELIRAEADDGNNVPYAHRPLTPLERAAGVRFGDIDAIITANTEDGTEDIADLYTAAAAALAAEIAGEDEALEDALEVAAVIALLLWLLRNSPTEYNRRRDAAAKRLTDRLGQSHTGGVLTVLDEARHQRIDTTGWATPMTPPVLGSLAAHLTDHPWQRSTEVLLHQMQTPRWALAGSITRAELRALTTPPSQAGTLDQMRQAHQGALAAGRMDAAALADVVPKLVVASEILDGATCGPCKTNDGRRYATLEEARADYPSGYFRCAGGSRCRGVLVYSWNGDTG